MRLPVKWLFLILLISVISVQAKNFVAQMVDDPMGDEEEDESGSGEDDADGQSGDNDEASEESGVKSSDEDGNSLEESGKKVGGPKKDRQNGGGRINGKDGGGELQAIVDANQEFSGKVYPAMVAAVGDDENLICSVLSLNMLMAMVSMGAKGQTKQEMDSALALPQDDDAALQGYKAVMEKLQSNDYYTIEAANKLFVGNDFEFVRARVC